MIPGVSFKFLYDLAIGLYSEPVESSLETQNIYLRCTLILLYNVHSGLFLLSYPRVFPIRNSDRREIQTYQLQLS